MLRNSTSIPETDKFLKESLLKRRFPWLYVEKPKPTTVSTNPISQDFARNQHVNNGYGTMGYGNEHNVHSQYHEGMKYSDV